MSDFRIDQITNQAGTAGPQIAGITTFSGSSGLVMPSGATEYRGGRGRGIFAGGATPTQVNTIDFITISSTGNASDFGDLTQARSTPAACSSPIRGVFGGGYNPTIQNTIDFVTISTQGNAIDFGDLFQARWGFAGLSNAHGGL